MKLFNLALNSKVTIYVPATVNVNEQIDNTKYVRFVQTELAALFGGSTATPSVGAWIDATGATVYEKTTMVFAYCTTEQLQSAEPKLLALCKTLCADMSQECIAVEINGQMGFIK